MSAPSLVELPDSKRLVILWIDLDQCTRLDVIEEWHAVTSVALFVQHNRNALKFYTGWKPGKHLEEVLYTEIFIDSQEEAEHLLGMLQELLKHRASGYNQPREDFKFTSGVAVGESAQGNVSGRTPLEIESESEKAHRAAVGWVSMVREITVLMRGFSLIPDELTARTLQQHASRAMDLWRQYEENR